MTNLNTAIAEPNARHSLVLHVWRENASPRYCLRAYLKARNVGVTTSAAGALPVFPNSVCLSLGMVEHAASKEFAESLLRAAYGLILAESLRKLCWYRGVAVLWW